jgi:hypothetical protein
MKAETARLRDGAGYRFPVTRSCILPGVVLMAAISSATLVAGTEGCTVRTVGAVAATVTASKLFTGSYGTLSNKAGLAA